MNEHCCSCALSLETSLETSSGASSPARASSATGQASACEGSDDPDPASTAASRASRSSSDLPRITRATLALATGTWVLQTCASAWADGSQGLWIPVALVYALVLWALHQGSRTAWRAYLGLDATATLLPALLQAAGLVRAPLTTADGLILACAALTWAGLLHPATRQWLNVQSKHQRCVPAPEKASRGLRFGMGWLVASLAGQVFAPWWGADPADALTLTAPMLIVGLALMSTNLFVLHKTRNLPAH